jgi:hypothetical protein
VLTVVDLLEFGGGEVCAGGVQPAVVVPVDPFEGGDLDVVEDPPGALAADQLGLEQADLGFGERVVAPIAVKPPRREASLSRGVVACEPRFRGRGGV